MTYEQAYSKLEEISIKLTTDVGLDQAVKLFEEAIELSKVCYDKLKAAEGKIQVFKGELENLSPLKVD